MTTNQPPAGEPETPLCGEIKKPLQSPLALTDKERATLRASALADMEKHGFTTPEVLIDYYDRKRGY